MGSGCHYKCTNADCGYEAAISGGRDWGFCGAVESMVCLDCKELMDVLTAPVPDLTPIQPTCEECEGTNLRKFVYGRTRCPKCKATLKRDDDSHYMWD